MVLSPAMVVAVAREESLSASSTGSMVLSPSPPRASSHCCCTFSILYRIDGFVTRYHRGVRGPAGAFQHPLPDRWFCHSGPPRRIRRRIKTFSILYRIDGFVTSRHLRPRDQFPACTARNHLSASSTGSMVLSPVFEMREEGSEYFFQHPLPDRWFCHPKNERSP